MSNRDMEADDLEIERRLEDVLDASYRLEQLCEPPGCSDAEYDEARKVFGSKRWDLLQFIGRARRDIPEPVPAPRGNE